MTSQKGRRKTGGKEGKGKGEEEKVGSRDREGRRGGGTNWADPQTQKEPYEKGKDRQPSAN